MHRLFENKISPLRFFLLLCCLCCMCTITPIFSICSFLFIFVFPLCHFIIIHDDTFLLCSWIISSFHYASTKHYSCSNNHDQLTLTHYNCAPINAISLVSLITCHTNPLTCFFCHLQITQQLTWLVTQ